MAKKPRQSALASQSRRAMSLGTNDPRVRRGSQGFSGQEAFFLGPGLFQNQFGEVEVDVAWVCEQCKDDPKPPGPCPPGFHRDPKTGECVKDPVQCPPNTTYNPLTGECDPLVPIWCPPGTTLDPQTGRCVADPQPGSTLKPGCGCNKTAGGCGADTLAWMEI